jgi:DNA mismatch repair protein MSH5
MSEDNVIHIVGGRHPLEELVVPAFVENDTHIEGGRGLETANDSVASVLLLTGANYSGKSVYLRQVKELSPQLTRRSPLLFS